MEARRPPLSGHNRYTDVPSSRPVSLRSKLQRLDGSRLQPAPASPAPAASAAPPSLEDLRRRIAAVLSRGAAPSPSPPAPRPEDAPSAELPFVAEETAHGTLHVRTLRLSAAHRTGHAPVLPARDASPALLSLLALDPSLAACSPRGALYLDTETTGLHGGTGTVAFLVGLAFWGAADGAGGGDLIVEQLLVKQLGEEAPVLARVAERLEAASMLVTFNGKSFDMPLLRTRFTMARMPWPGERPHLDLLHVARRLHKVRGIECRLTTIEREVLGFERVGDVPGSEVSARYLHYLRTGDAFPLLGVVEHNAWDVVAMAALVGLYGEPLDASMLAPEDLVGVARTLAKAGETAQAFEVASRVVEGAGGRHARGTRARMRSGRGRRSPRRGGTGRGRWPTSRRWRPPWTSPSPRPSGSSSPSCTSTTSRRRSRPSPWRSRGRASPPSSPASGTGGSRPRSSARRGGSARCPAWTQARRAGRPGRDAEPGSVLDRGACPPTHPSPAALATTPRRSSPSGRRYWEENQTFRAERHAGRAKKLYVLDMFPYPSGAGLHVGHPEGYTATDIVARYWRMRGLRRASPDGLGRVRPARRAARDPDRHAPARHDAEEHRDLQAPAQDARASATTGRARSTRPTRATSSGRSGSSCSCSRRGSRTRRTIPVNWCPALGTVLANEEVIDGKSERGGHPVERLPLRQWMLQDHRLCRPPRRRPGGARLARDTKAKQRHWIGRSEGARDRLRRRGRPGDVIRVFTTRVDTLSGATYVVVAPEHPLVAAPRDARPDGRGRRVHRRPRARKSDIDRTDSTKTKTGVAARRARGEPDQRPGIPIWVADYVIGTYGTGAVMAVPAHDERDHAFAKTYGLPIVQVVAPATREAVDVAGGGVHRRRRGARRQRAPLDRRRDPTSAEVRKRTTAWLAEATRGARGSPTGCATGSSRGSATGESRSRSTSRSRRRTATRASPARSHRRSTTSPSPSTSASCRCACRTSRTSGPATTPRAPSRASPTGGSSRRAGSGSPARRTRCRSGPARAGTTCASSTRETTTAPFSAEAYDAWMPVDLYVGGAEHAVLHLLYARFWHKVLFDLGIVKDPEPFTKLVHQGIILGENGEKMAKSRGNVVNPDDVVKSHGADALRLYEMFMGPLEQMKPWQTSGIEGVRRFLDRVWNVCDAAADGRPGQDDLATQRLVHKTMKKVDEDIEAMRFNTAISAMMILVKHLGGLAAVPRDAARSVRAPRVALRAAPGRGALAAAREARRASLAYEAWPAFDPALVKDDVVEIGVQVNGKVRGVVALAVDADEATARGCGAAEPKVRGARRGEDDEEVHLRAGEDPQLHRRVRLDASSGESALAACARRSGAAAATTRSTGATGASGCTSCSRARSWRTRSRRTRW